MRRPILCAFLVCALGTLGCGQGPVSPFREVADLEQLAGTYRNDPSAPGYGGMSLWALLRPNFPRTAEHHIEDQPTDRVTIDVAPDGRVTADLSRSGTVIDRQVIEFARRRSLVATERRDGPQARLPTLLDDCK